MKVLEGDTITGVSASSEDSNFPASNLRDDHPKRLYKADSANQSRLRFSVAAGTEGLAIFNTNATRAVANISDPNALNWRNVAWQNVEWIAVSVPTTTYVISSEYSRAIWVEFAALDVAVHVDVTLTNLAETVHAGCARGGAFTDFGVDPQASSFAEYLVDMSIEYELSNGSYYTKDRDVLRGLKGRVVVQREPYFNQFMSVARAARKKPMAWMVTSQGANWVMFAKFATPPSGAHPYPTLSTIDFNLLEVL